ncbi:branched-chain amino acid ABC transporter permease [Amaricoccus solimangrovi]|uniref:Branched-chain amino acid ABC transporter permease n=1 Tax=Amaricoccus solimangrovi TaxID=2589815 RepID=A0A501WY30_9RHOB|nr:branched-chain amino acid ABC transporter permease [Amaricoccus solimangrovi]TPE53165.1 branched-chain amino acid ABC transporter permease [Amaricoccus solimangrovi]
MTTARLILLHLAFLAALGAVGLALPAYHEANLVRIMLLSVFAIGYNIAFGYAGLLSLGHALFFAAGMYAAGLGATLGGWGGGTALGAGIAAGALVAFLTGLLALRASGTAFMIVTLMFAQAGALTILQFGEITRGDEGFVVPEAARALAGLPLTDETARFAVAFAAFALALVGSLLLARSALGRVLVAMRENAERARMLGYDPFRYRLIALTLSGLCAGTAGALYALAFGYVGASFAGIQYSILPLLWVLTGGAGTVLGPFLGTLVMYYLVDLAGAITTATLMVVGAALLALVLFAPKGILGALRARVAPWLP